MRALSHVIFSLNVKPEPAATRALGHILKSSPGLAQEFLNIFENAGIELEFGRVATEVVLPGAEQARSDLAVYDAAGTLRLLVENKFWAGLTDAQPVSYLNALPEEDSALLFIVPAERLHVIWNELTARCANAGMILGEQAPMNDVTWVHVNTRTLLITSWHHVLAMLQLRAHVDGLHQEECDITQLNDLAMQMDWDAFLPLRAKEVTNQAISKRLVNYIDLALTIVQSLNLQDNVGEIANGTNDREVGRYFQYQEAFQMWLGVSNLAWKECGVTPIWCFVDNENFPDIDALRLSLEEALELSWHNFYASDYGLYIPLLLTLGVEIDAVTEDVVAQVNQIAEILLDHHAE